MLFKLANDPQHRWASRWVVSFEKRPLFLFYFYQIPSLFLPKSLFFFSLAYILRRVPGGSRQGGGGVLHHSLLSPLNRA